MKNILTLTIFFTFIVATTDAVGQINLKSGNENEQFSNAPDFKWNTTSSDLGTLEHNKPGAFTFTFTNTGNAPLIITQVKGSCECTTAEFTRTPIPPGKTGWVKAIYDSTKLGDFNRNVSVTSNADGGPVTLNIKGNVVAKKK